MRVEEIVGKTEYDLFPTEEAKKNVIIDKAVMSSGRQQKEEWEPLGEAGLRRLRVVKTPVLDEKGECTGVLCSITDISKYKQVEKTLKITSLME